MHENIKIQRQTGCGNEKQIESHSGLFTETFKDVRVCEADIECVCVRGRGSKADRPTMKTMVLKNTHKSFIHNGTTCKHTQSFVGQTDTRLSSDCCM